MVIMEPLPTTTSSSGGQQYFEDPIYEPLTGPFGRAAVNGQLFKYPKVLRSARDPAIQNQNVCLLSFHTFEEPKIIKSKDGKDVKIFAMVKVRGVFAEADEATRNAARIIREVDSLFKIGVAEVGKWHPVVENVEVFSGNTMPISSMEDMEKQREKEEIRRNRLKRAEDNRKKQDFMERQRQAEEEDINANPETLDYATLQATVWLKLFRDRQELKAKMDNMTKKLKTQHEIIEYLRRRHPEHFENDAWLELANKERRKESIIEEVLFPDERKAFEKRLESTRAPKGVTREAKRVMIDLKGPYNDKGNFDLIYPEYEEDYLIVDDDTEVDRIHKANNLKLYHEKVERAAKGDRKAMAAVCPWKLDDYGRALPEAEASSSAPTAKLPPGTEDGGQYPDTENIPNLLEAEKRLAEAKGARQQVYEGREPPESLRKKPPPDLILPTRITDPTPTKVVATPALTPVPEGPVTVPTQALGEWMDYSPKNVEEDLASGNVRLILNLNKVMKSDVVKALAATPTEDDPSLFRVRVWLNSGETFLLEEKDPGFMKLPKEWSATIGDSIADMSKMVGPKTRLYTIK